MDPNNTRRAREASKQGYMWKENDFGLMRKEWRKRFFILEGPTTNGAPASLRFYDREPVFSGPTASFPRATIPLQGSVVSDTKHPRLDRFAFRLNLVPRTGQKAHKLILAANSLAEVWEWMAAFKACGVSVTFQGVGMKESEIAEKGGALTDRDSRPPTRVSLAVGSTRLELKRVPLSPRGLPVRASASFLSATYLDGISLVYRASASRELIVPAHRASATRKRIAPAHHASALSPHITPVHRNS